MLTPLAEARAWVLDRCHRLGSEQVPLADALGRVLAEPVISGESVPAFANTAMDGYALRAADTFGAPVELDVVATIAAGRAVEVALREGQAARIMTGAPMPLGADAVVMVEQTSSLDEGRRVRIDASAEPGQHVRGPGEDISSGQCVVEEGTSLRPAHLGVLASIGCGAVIATRRPLVGVLSTGDEVVPAGVAPAPGQIRDSNRATLLAAVELAGCTPLDLGIVADEESAVESAITKAAERCDALLTSGGVSMGDFDYVKVVLSRLGEMRWMQVAIRPAKPLAFGTVGGMAVFGLPGNPVSSMVSFELFARPALRRMQGHAEVDRPRLQAVADEGLPRHPDGKLHLVRTIARWDADGRLHVRSAGGQASHHLLAASRANALVFVPDGPGIAERGFVEAMLIE